MATHFRTVQDAKTRTFQWIDRMPLSASFFKKDKADYRNKTILPLIKYYDGKEKNPKFCKLGSSRKFALECI